MFDNVKYLDGFFQAPVLVLLGNDEVYVHVGVDKIPVGGPPHGALNAHQTVLLRPLEYGPRVEILRMTRIFYVGPYPTYIFAPKNKEIQSRHPISQRSTKLCSFVINLKKKGWLLKRLSEDAFNSDYLSRIYNIHLFLYLRNPHFLRHTLPISKPSELPHHKNTKLLCAATSPTSKFMM